MVRRTMLLGIAVALALFLVGGPVAAGSPDTGSADFTRFVALGDSLVAGESSASLVETFQDTSIPRLIWLQATGGAGSFEQPLVSEPGNPARLGLCPDLSVVPLAGVGVPLSAGLPRPFDNLGMAGGARVNDLLTISGITSCAEHPITQAGLKSCFRLNLTLRDRGTALEQALELDPTLALLWIGANDANYAVLTGEVVEGLTLTPVASFETDYRAVTDALAASGADLVLATIPDPTLSPFGNTIPPVVVDPATLEPIVIAGSTVPLVGPAGPLAPGDRVTLFAQPWLADGCGIPDAIDGGFDPRRCPDGALSGALVVDAAEAAAIAARVEAFNEVVRDVADELHAALFDAAAYFRRIAREGLEIGGIELTFDFLTGGLVSYDGIHPTSLGHALLANGFIEAINRRHDAEIPLVDLSPFLFGPAGSFPPIDPARCTGARVSEETVGRIATSLAVPLEPERVRPETRRAPVPGAAPRGSRRSGTDR